MKMGDFLKEFDFQFEDGEVPDSIVSLMREIKKRTEAKKNEIENKSELSTGKPFKVLVDSVRDDAVDGIVAFGTIAGAIRGAGGHHKQFPLGDVAEAVSLLINFLAATDDFLARKDRNDNGYEIDPAFA